MANALDLKVLGDTAEFDGFLDLLAHITLNEWLMTAGIIVLAGLLTWGLRYWLSFYNSHHNIPSWLSADVLTKVTFPLFLWLFSTVLKTHSNLSGADSSSNWYEFLSQMFGAFLLVRLFLLIVRRALPNAGSLRQTIETCSVILIWAVMLLNYVGKLDVVTSHLNSIHITIGKHKIVAGSVLALVLVFVVVWLVVKWLNHEFESLLLHRPNGYFSQFDLSTRVVLVRIIQALLVVMGVLFSLTASGIDLTVLSVFGGALGVGIGLGLQKIASNYVSGFVILFERSVRIGDLITLPDGLRGNVTQINGRYTIVQGTDGSEILVPNEVLVTAPVVNWSLHTKNLWMSTSVQVLHTTDVDFIRPKLLEAISAVPRVLASPGPSVFLSKITEKGYVLDFSWWIEDPENGRMNVTSDINLAIWRTCTEHGVGFFQMVIELDKEKQNA